jgi:hypothetical protein
MMSPYFQQPIVGYLPQPQAKRHRSALQVFRQPPNCFQLCFLDDIGRINPRPELGIKAQTDHLTQESSVAAKKTIKGTPVPVTDLVQ